MHKINVGVFAAVAVLAGAGQASAAERMSDTAYLSAMRCRGLAEARQVDATSLDALLKAQRNGRDLYIGDRAKQMRRDAAREGRSADRQARVDAELNGVCQAYFGGAAMAGRISTGG